MLYFFNLNFKFIYSSNLYKKTQKFKINRFIKNSVNLEKINFSEKKLEKKYMELDEYFKSLPLSLKKNQSKIDFFSFLWLQKIGRTDLCCFTKTNQTFLKKKNDLKDLPTYYFKRKTDFLNYKNRSKISLGSVVEEKILNYSSQKHSNTNINTFINQNSTVSQTIIIKQKFLHKIKINKIDTYEIKINFKFIIFFFSILLLIYFQKI